MIGRISSMDDRAGPNNCMPPVRIGLVVIDFGPIFSWSGRWFGVNWSEILARPELYRFKILVRT